jgi:hypothetical protein
VQEGDLHQAENSCSTKCWFGWKLYRRKFVESDSPAGLGVCGVMGGATVLTAQGYSTFACTLGIAFADLFSPIPLKQVLPFIV